MDDLPLDHVSVTEPPHPDRGGEDGPRDRGDRPEPAHTVAALRPPPKGLSRRDRRTWRRLEVARLERDITAAARSARADSSEWDRGFIHRPPRGVGRTGRRAWLAAERADTTWWWQQRRASTRDIDTRAVGVLTIALLTGAALLGTLLTAHPTTATSRPALATAVAVPTVTFGLAPTTPTADTDGARSTLAAASRTILEPNILSGTPLVAGFWVPMPAGGVTPIAPVPAQPIDPKTVTVQQVRTGPATPAELSTPVGAVRAWLERTCPSTWSDPFGADIRRGRSVMTTAGWAAANPATDTAGRQLWKAVVADRQTRRCGNFTVQLSPDAPIARGTAFVEWSADRVVTSPTTPSAVVEHLVGARIVVRQSDGRWLVDRPVVGG